MSRILYCECGEFIPIDVQDTQSVQPKKCIVCGLKEVIAMIEKVKRKHHDEV